MIEEIDIQQVKFCTVYVGENLDKKITVQVSALPENEKEMEALFNTMLCALPDWMIIKEGIE